MNIGDTVTLRTLHGEDVPARIVKIDAAGNLAMLEVDLDGDGQTDRPPLPIARSTTEPPAPFTWRPS